jgi:hypothetical protein
MTSPNSIIRSCVQIVMKYAPAASLFAGDAFQDRGASCSSNNRPMM